MKLLQLHNPFEVQQSLTLIISLIVLIVVLAGPILYITAMYFQSLFYLLVAYVIIGSLFRVIYAVFKGK